MFCPEQIAAGFFREPIYRASGFFRFFSLVWAKNA
jgi:hypothetical protein